MFLLCIIIITIICTYLCDLSREASWNITIISEHGVFPLVSVQVWHGEPGNMHPYNFESQNSLLVHFLCQNLFGQIIVRNPKQLIPRPSNTTAKTCWMILEWTKDSALCRIFFWVLIVHKLITPYPKDQSAQFFLAHQPVRVQVTVTACVVNKVLISNSILHGMVS